MHEQAPLPVDSRGDRVGLVAYGTWSVLALCVAFAAGGSGADKTTRALVLAFLAAQAALRGPLSAAFPTFTPGVRFVALGTLLAAVVEAFHMLSRPVFASLRVTAETPLALALGRYGLDLLFTVPAYVVIFSAIYALARRYRLSAFQYAFVMGLGQTLGDGGLVYFLAAPGMLVFLPWPMTNYHACNVIPFLAVRDDLAPNAPPSRAWTAIPALVAVYFCLGALVQVVGAACGLR